MAERHSERYSGKTHQNKWNAGSQFQTKVHFSQMNNKLSEGSENNFSGSTTQKPV
jgi:hypothetical protein